MATEFFIANSVSSGMLVKLERIRRGWRQADLAQAADVTQSEVSLMERDVHVIPSVRHRIHQALDLDIEER